MNRPQYVNVQGWGILGEPGVKPRQPGGDGLSHGNGAN